MGIRRITSAQLIFSSVFNGSHDVLLNPGKRLLPFFYTRAHARSTPAVYTGHDNIVNAPRNTVRYRRKTYPRSFQIVTSILRLARKSLFGSVNETICGRNELQGSRLTLKGKVKIECSYMYYIPYTYICIYTGYIDEIRETPVKYTGKMSKLISCHF